MQPASARQAGRRRSPQRGRFHLAPAPPYPIAVETLDLFLAFLRFLECCGILRGSYIMECEVTSLRGREICLSGGWVASL